MLANQEDQQLIAILQETQGDSNYLDQELSALIGTAPSKADSLSPPLSPTRSMTPPMPNPFASIPIRPSEHESIKSEAHEDEQEKHYFADIYDMVNGARKAEAVQSVRQKYPLFELSQPTYSIKQHIRSTSYGYSGNLAKRHVLVLEVGYCEQQRAYRVAAGTNQGQVIIFQPSNHQPQQIIDCFQQVTPITCVKWSNNLMFLAIATQDRQLQVYKFKQSIRIEDSCSYRMIKQPTSYCIVGQQKLQHPIIQIQFVREEPMQLILTNDNQQIMTLQMKLHFITERPVIQPLPIQFTNFAQVVLHSLRDQHGVPGKLVAVGGNQFITLCLLEPKVEVVLMYDRNKHGRGVSKRGYPHISFQSSPNSLLILWDRYLEILAINIEKMTPLRHRIHSTHRCVLPDSTLAGGFLSSTLIYQLTPIGLKVYSTTSFSNEQEPPSHAEACQLSIEVNQFPVDCLQDLMGPDVTPNDIMRLTKLFCVAQRRLFYGTNSKVCVLELASLKEYINQLVENNSWKAALAILRDCHRESVHCLDLIDEKVVRNLTTDTTARYINFLQTIIATDSSNASNIELLWGQQLMFIFSTLIAGDLQQYMLEHILPKVHTIQPVYLKNMVPFMLTNQFTTITPDSLLMLVESCGAEVVGRLVLNLKIVGNDPELPHQINNCLIQSEMWLEFVELNMQFSDYYTPIALLTSKCLSQEIPPVLPKLLAYCLYQTILSMNLKRNSKAEVGHILSALLPLLLQHAFRILTIHEPVPLFTLILPEIYTSQCLEALNQLSLTHQYKAVMEDIVKAIPEQQLDKSDSQGHYWWTVLRLISRGLVNIDAAKGLRHLVNHEKEAQKIEEFTNQNQLLICRQLKGQSEEWLQRLYSQLLCTKHIALTVIVGRITRQHLHTIQAILHSRPHRDQVFVFIEDCLEQLTKQEVEQLKSLLKNNIQTFTQINAFKTTDLICRHYLPDLNMFIDDLHQYPQEQLKLIRQVLQMYQYGEKMHGLKVRYLQLLASQGQHLTILSELMKENYPLDESLEISRKWQVLEPQAYLLAKAGGQGNNAQAIRVYFLIIWNKLTELLLAHHEPINGLKLEELIMKYVQKCVDICVQLDLKHHLHDDNEWFLTLRQLERLKKMVLGSLVIDVNTCDSIKKVINFQAYPLLVRILIEEVTPQVLTLYLAHAIGRLELEAVEIIVKEMTKNYTFERRTYKIAESVFVRNQNSMRRELQQAQACGVVLDGQCDICNLVDGAVIRYGCGHCNHPACSQDVKDCFICEQDFQGQVKKRVDIAFNIRPEIWGLQRNDEEQVGIAAIQEDRLQRMHLWQEWTSAPYFDDIE